MRREDDRHTRHGSCAGSIAKQAAQPAAHDAAQARGFAVTEHGQDVAAPQQVQRPAGRVGRGHRHQHIVPQDGHGELTFVQAAGHVGMAVAQHELHAALQHQVFAGLRAVGHGLHRPQSQLLLQPGQPLGEKVNRQHVRGSKAQAGGGLVVRGPGLDARGLQVGQHLFQQRQKSLAGSG